MNPHQPTPHSLPEAPSPIGLYAPGVIFGNLLFLSGQTPPPSHTTNGELPLTDACQLDTAQDAARQAALNALSQAQMMLGSLQRVTTIVRVTGYVRSSPDFTSHALVINGASEALKEILGFSENHARSAIGVASLPHGAIVELDIVLGLR